MPKKEFTATEVMTLQERLEQGIAVIGEQYGTVIKRLEGLQNSVDGIREQVADNTVTLHIHGETLDQHTKILNQHTQDIKAVKSELTDFQKEHTTDMQEIKQGLKGIKQEIKDIKQDIQLVKLTIVHKADLELYDKLEERVRALEQKLLSLP